MSPQRRLPLLFLSWESPWPAHSGAALRRLGLFTELCKICSVDLIVLARRPLAPEGSAFLGARARNVTWLPLRDVSIRDRLRALGRMLRRGYPYHSAVLECSLAGHPEIRRRIAHFPGIVFTSTGHWGTLARDRPSPNWILNQCDADVDLWRVYANQAAHPLSRWAARLNYRFARRHYPRIYAHVGRIISVCEEDRLQTLSLAPRARVDVIENGVDCSYYAPRKAPRTGPPRLLFTGTSAARNVTALRGFVKNVLPLIRSQVPEAELLVGGDFNAKAQAGFAGTPGLRFTGRVDDMRPVFEQGDVFVAPFEETHGSKLKVAEAMAMGMAIVTTPAGIRGFSLADGESVLVARDDERFAALVTRLIRDTPERERLGAAARRAALATIDWAVLGKRLARIVESARAQRGRP